MAVAETFLQHGRVCTEPNALGKTLEERYARWLLLLLLPRRWCRDKRQNAVYAPVFLLLFGSSADCDGDVLADEADGSHWRLLLYDTNKSCQEVFWEAKGSEIVAEILRSVPTSLYPSLFEVKCVTVGNTHERLGLFSDRAYSLLKTRLEHVFAELSLKQISVSQHQISLMDMAGVFRGVVGKAVQWVVEHSSDAVDVSAPSQEGNDTVLEVFPRLNRLLYTARFREPDDDNRVPHAVYKGAPAGRGACGEGSFPALEEDRCRAIENLKKRAGHVTSFTLPFGSPAVAAEALEHLPWHVLLIQKPFVVKEEVSMENLDPGPLAPQPIGAELHLMRDGGEVLYLQEQLCDEKSFDIVYDDMMHEDGELFVQLTPIEGVAFDDIDRFLSFMSLHDAVKGEVSSEPLCEGSCSAYTFPKVVYRAPTGKVEKDTPIASAHVKVVESSPRTTQDWAVAAAALEFLSKHITPCSVGGYTLARDVAPVPAPPHSDVCSWCHRRRDKLLRCGSCRVDMYCCKKHQMLSWKNGHRKMCELWRRARDEFEHRVLPLLHERRAELPSTPMMSNAVTLLTFLLECASDMQHCAKPVIHLVGIDSGVKLFLSEFVPCIIAARRGSPSQRLSWKWEQLRLQCCSDAFEEEDHNAVYAVAEDGEVVRTPPTTVLGDVWHVHSPGGIENAVILLRFYSTKYHVFVNDTMGGSNGSHVAAGRDDRAPSAVVYFGGTMEEGMSYFSGVAEVLADRFLGVVPVLCTEMTLVNAHNTLDAILARVENSTVMSKGHKSFILSRYKDVDGPIQLNVDGMGTDAVVHHSAGVGAESSRMSALSRHPNLYRIVFRCQ